MKFLNVISVLFILQGYSHAEDRPNIVLIMADDMGWSDIGCYGGEIPTPNIDTLAEGGKRFTQFYNNSICGPTRASLLTGLYCQQTGHRGDRWNEPKNFTKCATFAELLKDAGYHTMMVGKWQGRDSALDRGFDKFFGPMCQGKISYFHEVDKNPFFLNKTRWKLPDDFFMTESFNDYAETFTREAVQAEKPFLLYVGYIAPHWPLHARERDIAPHRDRYLDGWDELRLRRYGRQQAMGLFTEPSELPARPSHMKDWQTEKQKVWQAERMAVYAAQIANIDRGVGRVLKVLEDSGKDKNTLVLFLSDNGAAPDGGTTSTTSGLGFRPNSKSRWRLDGVQIRPGSGPQNMPGPHDTFAAYGLNWATVSNTPLRGTKLAAYEGGIRTPLIARWPNVISKPGLTRQVGHVMDFMPTFLDIAESTYPKQFKGRTLVPVQGRSLLPIFRGEERQAHPSLCWSTARGQAVRAGNWKLVNSNRGKPWELYDLENDPCETTNVASERTENVAALAEEFGKWEQLMNAR